MKGFWELDNNLKELLKGKRLSNQYLVLHFPFSLLFYLWSLKVTASNRPQIQINEKKRIRKRTVINPGTWNPWTYPRNGSKGRCCGCPGL